jgi:hypothetical protein
MSFAIDKKLRVNRVRMPRGNAVPHVRETALKGLPAQFGSHFEGADELAHRAGVRKYWVCCQAISLLTSLLPNFNLSVFSNSYRLTAAAVSTCE